MIKVESDNDGIHIETRSTRTTNSSIDSNNYLISTNSLKLNNNNITNRKNSISNLIRFYETVYESKKQSESIKTTTPITNMSSNKKLHRQFSSPTEFNTKIYLFKKHHSFEEEIRSSLIDNANNKNFDSKSDEEKTTKTTSSLAFENKRPINTCSSVINKCQINNLNLNEHNLINQSNKSASETENSTFSIYRNNKGGLMDEKLQKQAKERNPSSSSGSSDTSSSAFLSPVEMRRTKSSTSSCSASIDSSENKQDEECTSSTSTSTSSSNIDCFERNSSKLKETKFVGIKKSLSAVNELKQVQMFSVVEIEKPVVANFLKSNQANSDRERTVNEQNNNENQSENNNTNNNTKAKIASVDKNNNNYSFNSVKNVVSKNSNYTRSFSNNNINFAYNSKSPNFINKVKNEKPSVNQSKSNYALSNPNQKRFEPQQVQRRLLEWCQYHTRNYDNVNITNFSTSWADGLAFCALIHSHLPDSFDFSKLMSNNRRQNFELAFEVAEEKAQIVPLLEVNDMILMGDRPDDRCIFTYVSTIYSRFNRMKMAQKQN